MSLIKFFSTVDEDFVRKNFKDISEAEKLIAKHRKKAVIVLGVLASCTAVLLIALGYAVMNINKTNAALKNVESTQVQVGACLTSAQQQATDAASAQAIAEEVNGNTLAQLEACSRKRNKK